MTRKVKVKPVDIQPYISAWAKLAGATECPSYDDTPEYKIDTVCGLLQVKAIKGMTGGAWIACRFQDPDRAADHFGVHFISSHRLNPYSGKWNFCEALGSSSPEAVEYMVRCFVKEVTPLLLTENSPRFPDIDPDLEKRQ